MKILTLAIGLLTSLLLLISSAQADPISIDLTTLRNFRDTRSLNNVGISQGDRNVFGADVTPNTNTYMGAQQGNKIVAPVPCNGNAVYPNNCTDSIGFNTKFSGAWNLTFTNGSDSATATTPELDPLALLGPVDFPANVMITGTGLTPTITWTMPGGFPDAFRIQVRNQTLFNQRGQDLTIFSLPLPGNTTSFTFPQGVLELNTLYSLNIQAIETRGHVDFSSDNPALIASRSSSFFDFTPLSTGSSQQAAFLPMVGPAPDPSTGFGATYQFNQIDIADPAAVTFIDPFVAIGYDYAIGLGDPNFASVVFPPIQRDRYLLYFPGEPGGVPVEVSPNTQFCFPSGGVSQFSVRGIHVSDNLDPNNVNAFITGVTFVSPGQFNGTMTPVLVEVASVPQSRVTHDSDEEHEAFKPCKERKRDEREKRSRRNRD